MITPEQLRKAALAFLVPFLAGYVLGTIVTLLILLIGFWLERYTI